MNRIAIEVFSTFGVGVLCIVLGIIVLNIFFKLINRIENIGKKPEKIALSGVLKTSTWAKVYMSGAETFDRVRLIGYANSGNVKTHLPYDLNGMVILEDERGFRFLVRAKAIRMIEIEPETHGSNMSTDL